MMLCKIDAILTQSLEVIFMPDYQKMYTTLFNAITDAVKSIQDGNFGIAKEILTKAQQVTEELYISDEE